MDKMDMSPEEALEDCRQAAEVLASQSDEDRDFETIIGEKSLNPCRLNLMPWRMKMT